MRLPPFHYLGPSSLEEALSLKGEYGADLAVLGGGTEIVGRLKHRLLSPSYVMGLKGIADRSSIASIDGEIRIRWGTTLHQIIESPLIANTFRALAEAADAVAAPPIQNVATIAGNILQNTRCLHYNQSELVRKGLPACYKAGGEVCRSVKGGKRCYSVYQGDLAPALIAFGARVKLERKGSSRVMPLSELFTAEGKTPFALQQMELLTEVIIPLPAARSGSAYRKLRLRSAIDFPLASVAAFLASEDGRSISAARVVIGAAGPLPKPVDGAASALTGKMPSPPDIEQAAEAAFQQAEAVNNLALPAAYRRRMIKVFTRRAIEAALQNFAERGRP